MCCTVIHRESSLDSPQFIFDEMQAAGDREPAVVRACPGEYLLEQFRLNIRVFQNT
jgi:hypothetical protein